MKIGTTTTQRAENTSRTSYLEDQHSLSEGDNLFRLVSGPKKDRTIFIPTVKEVDKDGVKTLEAGYAVFHIQDDDAGILDQCLSIERDIREGLGEDLKKVEIGFRPQTKFFYAAINKLERKKTIKLLRTPTTVKKDISDFESKVDLQDPEYLLNGLFWMYDLNISKIIDHSKKSLRFGTSYKTSIYKNQWESKVPSDWLLKNPASLVEAGEIELKDFFTEEELEAIEESTLDLDEIFTAMTSDEILEKLMQNPINLLGLRANSNKWFYPQVPEFKERLEALGLKTIEFNVQDSGKQIGKSSEDEVDEEKPKSSGLKLGGKLKQADKEHKLDHPSNKEDDSPEEKVIEQEEPEVKKPSKLRSLKVK